MILSNRAVSVGLNTMLYRTYICSAFLEKGILLKNIKNDIGRVLVLTQINTCVTYHNRIIMRLLCIKKTRNRLKGVKLNCGVKKNEQHR